MERRLDVYIDFNKKQHALGRLWLRSHSGHESASFEYADSWLALPHAFALDPAVPLLKGVFHTAAKQKIFGFISDCLPDRWGRTLLLRREKRLAAKAGEKPKALMEADFLLAVEDTARMGALRFPGLPQRGQTIPIMRFLGRLLSASTRLEANKENDEDLDLLLAPGSSLGGARPKALVQDARQNLWLAKFPGMNDNWDVPLWEYVCLALAESARLRVPEFKLAQAGGKNVLLVKRFDRHGDERIPFASAMTLLGHRDYERGSYLDLAEIVRSDGSSPASDTKEIWTRMIFNAMISNSDDHLRNHAYLRDLSGWRLSPLYDLESTPPEYKASYQMTGLYPDELLPHDEVFEAALAASEEFGLSLSAARNIMVSVLEVGKNWPALAREVNASKRDMETMGHAFRTELPKSAFKRHSPKPAKSGT